MRRGYRVPTLTENGFIAGAAEVICVANIKGYQVLWIQTDKTRVELIVTPKGNRITVKERLAPIQKPQYYLGDST